jgi:thiamine transporter ThiT
MRVSVLKEVAIHVSVVTLLRVFATTGAVGGAVSVTIAALPLVVLKQPVW